MAIRDQEQACSDPLALAPSQSPPYSSGSYDSIKTEVSGCPEDLTVGRAPTADDDDDDHDDHEDNDKMNDSEGMDPERLKAFNVSASESQVGSGAGAMARASLPHGLCVPQMFVRLFVDENLDRMVPISKQPKEKIQAIIESCSRQFPEFQERARKRIRTYLKSCRRMKKNGMEMVSPSSRPCPLCTTTGLQPHPWGSSVLRPDHSLSSIPGSRHCIPRLTEEGAGAGEGPERLYGSRNHGPGPTPQPCACHLRGRVWVSPNMAPSPLCLQTRPTPPHLTSAMAENILAAACESETRKAAKRMRLEIYQSSQVRAPQQPWASGVGGAGAVLRAERAAAGQMCKVQHQGPAHLGSLPSQRVLS